MRVRGLYPFQPANPAMPVGTPWQDWILSDGVFDAALGSFFRNSLSTNNTGGSGQSLLPPQPTTGAGGASFGGHGLALNADVISDILAATRAMPSWRAWEMEGMSWNGMAEENMQKYISQLGIQDVL